MKKGWWIPLLGVLFLLLLWEGLSQIIDSELILPGVLSTFRELIRIFSEEPIIISLVTTFFRVVVATLLSLLIGGVLGFFATQSNIFRGVISPLITTLRTVPVVAFILITLMWFSTSVIPIFSGVIMAFPIITQNILVASERKNLSYGEMATLFEFTRWQRFKHVQFPEVMGYLQAGILSSYGMCWKVVIAGEILAIPAIGLGRSMQLAMVGLSTVELFAYIGIAVLGSALGGALLGRVLRKYAMVGVST